MTAGSQQKLSEGDRAPDFELYTDEKESWRLSDHLDRPVLLLFFPGAFTSVCTTELDTVNTDLDRFGDARVVGISTDAPAVLKAFRSKNGFEFTLLSDHKANVSDAYGARYDEHAHPMNFDRVAKRAAFLITEDGVIRYQEVLTDARKLPNFDAVEQAIKGL